MTNQFLHQGSASLGPIAPVKNDEKWQKPQGGLWLTPVGGVTFYEFLGRDDESPESFTMDVSGKNILVVDISGFFKADNRYGMRIQADIYGRRGETHRRWDWEKLAEDYDGVYFTEEVLDECGIHCPLYGVDFPSLLLFR